MLSAYVKNRRQISVIFAAILFPLASWASNGSDRGGGDPFAQQFVGVARDLVSRLSSHGALIDSRLDLKRVESAINETAVQSTDEELSVHGASVTAINFPSEHRILINRWKWSSAAYRLKMTLALHEYLGILRVPDDKYQISGALVWGKSNPLDQAPEQLSAEQGSPLSEYDKAVQKLKQTKHPDSRLALAEQIFIKYFGFSKVSFSSGIFGSAQDLSDLAVFYAENLRSVLPFNFKRYEFIRINGLSLAARALSNPENVAEFDLSKQQHGQEYILTIDSSKTSEMAYTVKTSSAITSHEITVGWGELQLKTLISAVLANGPYVYYRPSRDAGNEPDL